MGRHYATILLVAVLTGRHAKGTPMLYKNRLLTPGPTPLPERVRLVMAGDMIHHRKPAFKALLGRVREGLAEIFGTAQPVLPLAASGTGAMTAAVTNLFAPGEKVLVVEGGMFGKRWTEIATGFGLRVTVLPVEWGFAVAPETVAAALDADPEIRGVLMQLSETSTTAQHPIEAVAAITRKLDLLLLVDGISGVGITPCPMDAWGIDCLLTGSQKGLMLPPGLALIALSERAWKKAEGLSCASFYFNLCKERENSGKNQTAFTPAISLIVGLAESLEMFREFGLENIYRKQWALTQMVRTGISALGLTLLAPKDPAWGVTGLRLPEGVAAPTLLARAADDYGVIMAAGQGEIKDKAIRIGHMGWVDFADMLAGLAALAGAFRACGGYLGCRNYLEQAEVAYHEALTRGYKRIPS